MKNIKTIFILVLSLILLFAVSCSNEGTTGGGTGVIATDLPNGYYQGSLSCKSCIMGNDFHADSSYEPNKKELLEQEYKDWFTTDFFYLKIDNNKLKWTREGDEQYIEDMEEVGALKSGSEYSVTYSSEDNTTYSVKTKETIRFTISGDTISITTYTYEESLERKNDSGSDVELKYSVVATYEGSLTKYAETETTETIEAKDFSTDTELSELLGTYRDNKSVISAHDTKVSYDASSKKIKIEGHWFIDGESDVIKQSFYIEKWTKTTKRGGKIIKLEGEMEDSTRGKAIVTYDYETKTLIGKFDWCYYDGNPKYSFNGKKI